MSQAGIISTSSGPSPPIVPTSFTTDVRDNDSTLSPGTAIPAANNLEILGRDTDQNSSNGIRTDADPQSGKFVYVELTNRAHGSGSTTSAPAVTDLITLAIPDNTAYNIQVEIVGYATNGLGVVKASETVLVYRRGGGATTVGAVDSQETRLNLSPFLAYTSTSGNNVLVSGFGSPGFNINWFATLTYIRVS